MARIIDSEPAENVENNPLLQKYLQSAWGFPDEVLLAGVKVRNKAGGPVMVLIGFCKRTPPEDAILRADLFVWTNANGSIESIIIYPKILVNLQRKTNSEMDVDNIINISDYFLYRSINGQKPSSGGAAFAVVKYWSNKTEDFIHKVISLPELELATN
jgi:hypothetical protein